MKAPETAQVESPITESEPTTAPAGVAAPTGAAAELSDEDAAEIARIVAGYQRERESAAEVAERAKQTKYPQDPLGMFKETGDLIMEAIKVEHPRMTPEQMREASGAE